MEYLDKKSKEFTELFSRMDEVLAAVTEVFKTHTTHLKGEKFLSSEELCRLLHISPKTLQQWRQEAYIPYFLLGGKYLYRQSEIIAWLDRHRG